ncbi:hypothetical protein [Streptomyces sp. WAC 06783]|uniref:hypothetical protein n=1 Tax=Streptomyces sp. WAC 06783 TaxID=2203211 RepID=UPI000F740EB4|nr:hypothetical protein [Streptomyces sp. WAC 06783]
MSGHGSGSPGRGAPPVDPPARRRPLRALWCWSSGRDPVRGRKHTGRFLFSRMLMLPALTFTVLALAGTAYFDVHGRTEDLRGRYAPALVELAHTRVSLSLAQAEAERRLGADDGEPLPQTDLVGLGERYPSLVTAASQSLNNAVQTGALSKAQEQEVRVVSGLVVAYDDWIKWADSHHDSRPLRRAGMEYATTLLRTGSTAVLNRIGVLETDLRSAVADLSGWRAMFAVTASAALLAVLVLAFVFVGLLDYVRARLRVRSPLLALYALPVLLVFGVLWSGVTVQHGAQQDVERSTARLGRISVPRAAGPERTEGADGPDAAIEKVDADLAGRLRGTHPGAWVLASVLALVVGAAGAVGCGLTLRQYGREHWKIDWRSA